MRLLCVHPGASWATADLFTGLYPALKRHGVETVEYALDGRIAFAGSWLSALYRRNKAGGMPKPTMADTLYLAEQGILERAFRFGVDWVLVIAGTYVLPDVYDLMRRAGLRVAVLLTESPYDMANEIEIAKHVNIVFTNERTAVPIFAEHCPAYYYQHAIDPAKHDPAGDDDDTVATHDVVFVGTGWPERIELLAPSTGPASTGPLRHVVDVGLTSSAAPAPARQHRAERDDGGALPARQDRAQPPPRLGGFYAGLGAHCGRGIDEPALLRTGGVWALFHHRRPARGRRGVRRRRADI